MKDYYGYIRGVQSGTVVASTYIKQAVDRLEALKRRDDIFFDEGAVSECFEFIRTMKHYSGKSAGKPFELLPYQKWILGSVIGIKYKDTGFRVCRETFILQARKNGKTSLIAALALYMLICDKEQNPSIGIVASSRDQARLCYEMCQHYAKSLDSDGRVIKQYRNYIKVPSNNGELKVYASDSSKLDGLNQSLSILDEGHAQRDNKLYSVMKSSMGFRQQPLMVQITTCGFLKEGYPCYETYKVSLESLSGVKEDDSFFPFIYMMDPNDAWDDESNWVKCNPALDVTITREYLRDQVTAAKNDSSQMVPVRTKNFNQWMSSASVWIPQEKIVKCMDKIDLEKFRGSVCYVGVDLASVSDLTALAVMIPYEGKFYFKNYAFLPEETFSNHANRELYQRFWQDGDLIVTSGNICDYQAITNKIVEISQILQIEGIYYDPYNSGQWAIQCTELGFNMQQFRQGLLHFSNPTKEMEKLVLSGDAVFDKSAMVLWEFGNVVLRVDAQQNVKPDRTSTFNKIDNVIASVECLGGYLANPVASDYEIFSLQ